jgi:peptidoglycan-associated lipoprotein
MNSIVKNTLLSVCAVGLLAGCASKDVEYEDSAKKAKKETAKKTEKSAVDNKMDNVAGSTESIVTNEEETNNNISNTSNDLEMVTNSGVNSIKSDINGQVVLLESVHFGFDKYKLTDEMRDISSANYAKIDVANNAYGDLKIKLEGNCDEWGTDEYNYALGLKRAKATKDALVADGISEDKILMVSFGESNPICTQRNNACWKMNRRVDYRLLP